MSHFRDMFPAKAAAQDWTRVEPPKIINHSAHKAAVPELITPAKAKELLEANKGNRPVRLSVVAQYRADMKAGRWHMNGETIKIDKEGTILDGQHRLLACVQSDVSFVSYIVRGLEPEVYLTIDIGSKRTCSDALAREGVKHSAATASAVRWLIRIEQAHMSRGNESAELTPAKTLEEVAKHPEIVTFAGLCCSVKFVPPSLLTALVYKFWQIDQDKAIAFLSDLQTGENLSSGDPVHTLRNRLIDMRMENKGRRVYTPYFEICALIIRAWNARRAGRKIYVLKGLVKNDAGKILMPQIE